VTAILHYRTSIDSERAPSLNLIEAPLQGVVKKHQIPGTPKNAKVD
jgi:hypothetical protein